MAGQLTVACLGDSITGSSNLAYFMKWSHPLQLMLEARLGLGTATVWNAGCAGNTTAQMLERVDAEVVSRRPQWTTILGGGNDAGQKVPRETTAANLRELVRRVRACGSQVMLLQYAVQSGPGSWDHLDDNNDLIAAVAAEAGCPVVDLGPEFRASGYSRDELVSPKDGVHLNPGGELVVARAVFAAADRQGWIRL